VLIAVQASWLSEPTIHSEFLEPHSMWRSAVEIIAAYVMLEIL
jgi:hypothetical protein